MNKRSKASAGFSLVEVAIALAVASFCLITISGLLSVGLSTSQTSSQETVMANIASEVAADLRATPANPGGTQDAYSPYYQIDFKPGQSTMATPAKIYVSATGATVSEDGSTPVTNANADFCVWVGLEPPANEPSGAPGVGATTARIMVTWPGRAAPTTDATGWPSVYSGSYGTVLALIRN